MLAGSLRFTDTQHMPSELFPDFPIDQTSHKGLHLEEPLSSLLCKASVLNSDHIEHCLKSSIFASCAVSLASWARAHLIGNGETTLKDAFMHD